MGRNSEVREHKHSFKKRAIIAFFVVVVAVGVVAVWKTTQTEPSTQLSSESEGFFGEVEQDILLRLTSYTWQYSGAGSDGFLLTFSPDGTFTWSVISDYGGTENGKWGYKELVRGEGLLFMLFQGERPAEKSERFFRFRFEGNNQLQLGPYVLKAVKTAPLDVHARNGVNIPVIIKEKNFPDYFQITAHPWKKNETKDNGDIPDQLVLKPDGAFTARYRHGECEHGGYWSLDKGKLLLELPTNHCDLRGYNTAQVMEYPYKFENDSLTLNPGVVRWEYRYTPVH